MNPSTAPTTDTPTQPSNIFGGLASVAKAGLGLFSRLGKATQAAPRKGKRILLIESDGVANLILRETLESMNFEVELASNGCQALQTVSSAGLDAILMDLTVGGMQGTDLIARVRENHKFSNRPVFVFTCRGFSGTGPASAPIPGATKVFDKFATSANQVVTALAGELLSARKAAALAEAAAQDKAGPPALRDVPRLVRAAIADVRQGLQAVSAKTSRGDLGRARWRALRTEVRSLVSSLAVVGRRDEARLVAALATWLHELNDEPDQVAEREWALASSAAAHIDTICNRPAPAEPKPLSEVKAVVVAAPPAELRKSLTDTLVNAGLTLTWLGDAPEASTHLDSQHADVVTCDVATIEFNAIKAKLDQLSREKGTAVILASSRGETNAASDTVALSATSELALRALMLVDHGRVANAPAPSVDTAAASVPPPLPSEGGAATPPPITGALASLAAPAPPKLPSEGAATSPVIASAKATTTEDDDEALEALPELNQFPDVFVKSEPAAPPSQPVAAAAAAEPAHSISAAQPALAPAADKPTQASPDLNQIPEMIFVRKSDPATAAAQPTNASTPAPASAGLPGHSAPATAGRSSTQAAARASAAADLEGIPEMIFVKRDPSSAPEPEPVAEAASTEPAPQDSTTPVAIVAIVAPVAPKPQSEGAPKPQSEPGPAKAPAAPAATPPERRPPESRLPSLAIAAAAIAAQIEIQLSAADDASDQPKAAKTSGSDEIPETIFAKREPASPPADAEAAAAQAAENETPVELTHKPRTRATNDDGDDLLQPEVHSIPIQFEPSDTTQSPLEGQDTAALISDADQLLDERARRMEEAFQAQSESGEPPMTEEQRLAHEKEAERSMWLEQEIASLQALSKKKSELEADAAQPSAEPKPQPITVAIAIASPMHQSEDRAKPAETKPVSQTAAPAPKPAVQPAPPVTPKRPSEGGPAEPAVRPSDFAPHTSAAPSAPAAPEPKPVAKSTPEFMSRNTPTFSTLTHPSAAESKAPAVSTGDESASRTSAAPAGALPATTLAHLTAQLEHERGERRRAEERASHLAEQLQPLHGEVHKHLELERTHSARVGSLEEQLRAKDQALSRTREELQQEITARKQAEEQLRGLADARRQQLQALALLEEAKLGFVRSRHELEARLETAVRAASESEAKLQKESAERHRLAEALQAAESATQQHAQKAEILVTKLQSDLELGTFERRRLEADVARLQQSLNESADATANEVRRLRRDVLRHSHEVRLATGGLLQAKLPDDIKLSVEALLVRVINLEDAIREAEASGNSSTQRASSVEVAKAV